LQPTPIDSRFWATGAESNAIPRWRRLKVRGGFETCGSPASVGASKSSSFSIRRKLGLLEDGRDCSRNEEFIRPVVWGCESVRWFGPRGPAQGVRRRHRRWRLRHRWVRSWVFLSSSSGVEEDRDLLYVYRPQQLDERGRKLTIDASPLCVGEFTARSAMMIGCATP
ncbi:hypothetical protein U1Q18_040913, partial [Sarracenia purpurea var. burkii]